MPESFDELRPLPSGFPTDFVVTDDAANEDPNLGSCPLQMHSPSTGAFTLLRVELQLPGSQETEPDGAVFGDYQVEPVGAAFVLEPWELVRFRCQDLCPLGVVLCKDRPA